MSMELPRNEEVNQESSCWSDDHGALLSVAKIFPNYKVGR